MAWANEAPGAAIARSRLANTWRACASKSPAPTSLPASSRATCPAVATQRPRPVTAWLYPGPGASPSGARKCCSADTRNPFRSDPGPRLAAVKGAFARAARGLRPRPGPPAGSAGPAGADPEQPPPGDEREDHHQQDLQAHG